MMFAREWELGCMWWLHGGAEVRVGHELGRSRLLVGRVLCITYGEATGRQCRVLVPNAWLRVRNLDQRRLLGK